MVFIIFNLIPTTNKKPFRLKISLKVKKTLVYIFLFHMVQELGMHFWDFFLRME